MATNLEYTVEYRQVRINPHKYTEMLKISRLISMLETAPSFFSSRMNKERTLLSSVPL